MQAIRDRIDEARVLWQNNYHHASIIILLVAIAGASRLRYPEKTIKSDREVFVKYVGEQFKQIGASKVIFGEEPHQRKVNPLKGSFVEILYSQLRCGLIHEGDVPETIEIDPQADHDFQQMHDRLILGKATFETLSACVIYDNSLFQYFRDLRKPIATDFVFDGDEEKTRDEIIQTFKITPGRLDMLKRFIVVAGFEKIRSLEIPDLQIFWNTDVIQNSEQFGVALGALRVAGHLWPFGTEVVLSEDDRLTVHGAQAIQTMAKKLRSILPA